VKVKELIELLQQEDPEAIIMTRYDYYDFGIPPADSIKRGYCAVAPDESDNSGLLGEEQLSWAANFYPGWEIKKVVAL
jgi:hypothetical protein